MILYRFYAYVWKEWKFVLVVMILLDKGFSLEMHAYFQDLLINKCSVSQSVPKYTIYVILSIFFCQNENKRCKMGDSIKKVSKH